MKNLILLIALLITGGLQAQTPQVITTTSASTPAGCATIDVSDNKGAVGFYVGGTWTGTLQPEVQVLNQAPGNSYVVPSTSSTTQTTITANGTYFFPSIAVVGASTALLCGPTTTGTANIYMLTSFASSTVPGSGGGGGLVSSVFGRTGAVTAQTGDYTCSQVTGCQSTTPPGSNGDIIFNNAGAFGGSATTINSAGTITVPDTQKVTDAAGNFIEFFSTGLSFIDASGDSIFLNSGQAIILDSVNDFISAGGGTNKWQIDNAAGSASITNPVGGGGGTIAFHGGLFTFDQGLVLNGATGGNQGAGSLNAQSLYINGTAVSAGGAVSSVFGRTGAVTAQTGDYTCAQVTNCGVGSNVKASVDCTQATCPGTDTTLFTTGSGASGSGQAGLYEIAFYAVTTASSPSCTAIDLNLTYTDESSLQSDISSFEWSATAVDSSTLTTSTPVSPQYFWSVPSSAIRYSITPIGLCSAVTYSAHLSLLQIR